MPELIPVAAILMVTVLGLPLVVTFTRHLERYSKSKLEGGGEGVRDQLREIRERLDAMEQDDARLAELEERVDFAERMLAQQQQPKIEGKT